MQGKALAALLALLAALALAGCGGGDEGGATTSAGAAAPQPSAQKKLELRAERVRRQRQRSGGDQGQPPGGPTRPNDVRAPKAKQPPKQSSHHDSGGGAAQFRTKGGDNSMEEFGEEGSAAERTVAAGALHGFLDSRAAGGWQEACAQLSAELVASMEQFAEQYGHGVHGCPDVLARLTGAQAPAALKANADVDVASLRSDGERGFLIYTGPDGNPYAIPVVLEEGTWKLAGLDGSPLP